MIGIGAGAGAGCWKYRDEVAADEEDRALLELGRVEPVVAAVLRAEV